MSSRSRALILGAALASLVGVDAATNAWLRSEPTSYLTTIDRRDFGQKTTMTVGRAADNDVRIDADGILPHHLRATVDGDRFHVTAIDPDARFSVKDSPLREATLDSMTAARSEPWLRGPVAGVTTAKTVRSRAEREAQVP